MPAAQRDPARQSLTGTPKPAVGEIAGLLAGVAFLGVQVAVSAVARQGGAVRPLQRVAAMVLGPDSAPPAAHLATNALALALLVHFALAIVYGRLVCALVWERSGPIALTLGAATGVALYGLNFELIAPLVFPWFGDALRLPTLADHALFGSVAAVVCVILRRRGA